MVASPRKINSRCAGNRPAADWPERRERGRTAESIQPATKPRTGGKRNGTCPMRSAQEGLRLCLGQRLEAARHRGYPLGKGDSGPARQNRCYERAGGEAAAGSRAAGDRGGRVRCISRLLAASLRQTCRSTHHRRTAGRRLGGSALDAGPVGLHHTAAPSPKPQGWRNGQRDRHQQPQYVAQGTSNREHWRLHPKRESGTPSMGTRGAPQQPLLLYADLPAVVQSGGIPSSLHCDPPRPLGVPNGLRRCGFGGLLLPPLGCPAVYGRRGPQDQGFGISVAPDHRRIGRFLAQIT